MRATLVTMLVLLTLAPLALAQSDSNDTRPTDGSADSSSPSQAAGDDAAWTDCDADVCAYGGDDCIECTRGPADGSCENCRGEEAQTCMDGTDPGEVCDDDVQYLGGPTSGEPEPGGAPVPTTESVPGASFAFVVAAIALAVFLLARRG